MSTDQVLEVRTPFKAQLIKTAQEDNDYVINFFNTSNYIGLNGYNGIVFNIENKSLNYPLSLLELEMYIRSDMSAEEGYRIFIAETKQILGYRASLAVPFASVVDEPSSGDEPFPISDVKRVELKQAKKIKTDTRETSHVLLTMEQGSLVLRPYTRYLLYILKDGFRYLAPSNTDYSKPSTGVTSDDASNYVIYENVDVMVYSGYGVMSHESRVAFQGYEPRYFMGKMKYQRLLPSLFKNNGKKLFQTDVTLQF